MIAVENNKKQFRFEHLLPDGEYIAMDYRWLKGRIVLMHTLVPVSARGTGMGAEFVQHVLEYVRQQDLKIVVYCPFVARYMDEHREYDELRNE